jgi:hypothetical protein
MPEEQAQPGTETPAATPTAPETPSQEPTVTEPAAQDSTGEAAPTPPPAKPVTEQKTRAQARIEKLAGTVREQGKLLEQQRQISELKEMISGRSSMKTKKNIVKSKKINFYVHRNK